MSISSADFSVIEPIKENIQPLKQGRNIEKLINTIQQTDAAPQSESSKAFYEKKRLQFQDKIDNYNGADPLSPWLSYIGWIQQSYYSSNFQKEVQPVLERCTELFKLDPQYQQDERFLKLYILYADTLKDAEDVFAFLEINNIGTNHALFWRAYSMVMNAKKKYQKTHDIIVKGIERQAKPVDVLKGELRRFKLREEKRKVMIAQNPELNDHEETEESRLALKNSKVIFSDRGISSVQSYDERTGPQARHKGLGGVLTANPEEAHKLRKQFQTQGLGYDTSVQANNSNNFQIFDDQDETTESKNIVPGFSTGLPVLPTASITVFDDENPQNDTSTDNGRSQTPTKKPMLPICGVSPNAKRKEWKKLQIQSERDKENKMRSSGNIVNDAIQGVVTEKTLTPDEILRRERRQMKPGLPGIRDGPSIPGVRGGLGGGLNSGMPRAKMLAPAPTKQSLPTGNFNSGSVEDRLKRGGPNNGSGSLFVFED